MSQFQQTVNILNALGIVGDIAFDDGGMRAIPANLVSTPQLNMFGNYFTLTSAATSATTGSSTSAINAAQATVGGTGTLGGILCNSKQNALYGTTSPLNPLGAANFLPDNAVGQLLQRGYVFVNLPGPANPGDRIEYDTTTGNLNAVAPTTLFTGAIAAGGASTADVLTVSAVAAGFLGVGSIIAGTGIPVGTVIISAGTGKGYTGTYNLSTINLLTVSSEAMTAGAIVTPAFNGAGYITTSAGVDTLHITTATSGAVLIGTQIIGAGILPNTVVTAFTGGAVGGTGTYTLNTSGQTVASSGSPETITSPTNAFVPEATVTRYQADTTGGVAVIKLSN